MDEKIFVARRVEDNPQRIPYETTQCSKCQKDVYIEPLVKGTAVCIHCADPGEVVFVELPPDEFGGRSEAKSVHEVRTAQSGRWHKSGVWHDQQYVINHQN